MVLMIVSSKISALFTIFSQGQIEDFTRLIVKVKDSKSSFELLFNKYSKLKAELFSIEKKNPRSREKS